MVTCILIIECGMSVVKESELGYHLTSLFVHVIFTFIKEMLCAMESLHQ